MLRRSGMRSVRSAIPCCRWVLTAVVALSCAGCAPAVGSAVGGAGPTPTPGPPPVGEIVAPAPVRPTNSPTSVNLAGPMPGWEHDDLRSAPSDAPSELFQANVFGGACPGLNIAGGTPSDPFSEGAPARFDLFENAPSHTIDTHYYRFGQVSLAGAAAPALPWQFLGMNAEPVGACGFVGIPVLNIGSRPSQRTAHR